MDHTTVVVFSTPVPSVNNNRPARLLLIYWLVSGNASANGSKTWLLVRRGGLEEILTNELWTAGRGGAPSRRQRPTLSSPHALSRFPIPKVSIVRRFLGKRDKKRKRRWMHCGTDASFFTLVQCPTPLVASVSALRGDRNFLFILCHAVRWVAWEVEENLLFLKREKHCKKYISLFLSFRNQGSFCPARWFPI